MFGSKSASSGARGVETLVARNTVIEGTVRFTGVLTVEGVIDGDIHADNEKDSVVRIAVDGKIKGDIRSPDAVINGHVVGNVHTSGQLILASDAVIDGNLHYNLLEVEQGAQINGNMVHTPPAARATDKQATTATPAAEPQERSAGHGRQDTANS